MCLYMFWYFLIVFEGLGWWGCSTPKVRLVWPFWKTMLDPAVWCPPCPGQRWPGFLLHRRVQPSARVGGAHVSLVVIWGSRMMWKQHYQSKIASPLWKNHVRPSSLMPPFPGHRRFGFSAGCLDIVWRSRVALSLSVFKMHERFPANVFFVSG